MTTDINIVRGGYDVTIRTVEITDDWSNQIKPIIIPTTAQKQDGGPATNKVIDLLKISHTLQVRGVLTNTTDRNNLISIFKGGGIEGTPCTITYNTHPNNPLSMYIEKLMIIEKAITKSANNPYQYEVQLTLFEGVKV